MLIMQLFYFFLLLSHLCLEVTLHLKIVLLKAYNLIDIPLLYLLFYKLNHAFEFIFLFIKAVF